MRKLNTGDLMKCVGIAGRISYRAKDALKIQKGEEVTSMQVGMAFFSVGMQYAETEIKELLAGVAEMSTEEFDKQSFDFPIEVIEHIAETEDLPSFLQRVTNLAKQISKKQ